VAAYRAEMSQYDAEFQPTNAFLGSISPDQAVFARAADAAPVPA
jgi:hypothetical protein